MTRALRRRHVVMWAVIGPAALIGLVLALLGRRPVPVQPASAPTLLGAAAGASPAHPAGSPSP